MKKVAIVGTVGVPASYGGFETLVENIIGDNCSQDIEYTVFCSSKDCQQQLDSYKGAKLKYISLRANGMQSIMYDGLSLLKSIKGYDTVVVLGVSGGVFLPLFKLLSRSRLIVNIDGLEWKRAKWGGFARWFLRLSEKFALCFADTVIADNQGIIDYIKKRHKKKTVLIAYGSDHVVKNIEESKQMEILSAYGVESQEYAMTLCRIEPENNCDMILEVFARNGMPLVFVGNWGKSEYGANLKTKYSKYKNIHIADAIYDLEILYVLRSNSRHYVHGHSAGGTNPSLVEAMFCGCNILAYDVVYNRETTESGAYYFKDVLDLAVLTLGDNKTQSNSSTMVEIANRRYTWATIAQQYESLYK